MKNVLSIEIVKLQYIDQQERTCFFDAFSRLMNPNPFDSLYHFTVPLMPFSTSWMNRILFVLHLITNKKTRDILTWQLPGGIAFSSRRTKKSEVISFILIEENGDARHCTMIVMEWLFTSFNLSNFSLRLVMLLSFSKLNFIWVWVSFENSTSNAINNWKSRENKILSLSISTRLFCESTCRAMCCYH